MLLSLVSVAVLFVFISQAAVLETTASGCRLLPSDAQWPSVSTWKRLNDTIQGRLVATIPLASPCHDTNFNAGLCTDLEQEWPFAQTQ